MPGPEAFGFASGDRRACRAGLSPAPPCAQGRRHIGAVWNLRLSQRICSSNNVPSRRVGCGLWRSHERGACGFRLLRPSRYRWCRSSEAGAVRRGSPAKNLASQRDGSQGAPADADALALWSTRHRKDVADESSGRFGWSNTHKLTPSLYPQNLIDPFHIIVTVPQRGFVQRLCLRYPLPFRL